MSDAIKAGDIVQLKSGGPRMTVSQVGERAHGAGPGAWCEWFDAKSTLQNAVFSPEALQVIKRA